MRNADTVLAIIHERGERGLPLERIHRLLYNKDLYLRAYAKLYPNKGAMTPGTTTETVDGMSLMKIPLKWNKWVAIHDEIDRVWSGRSEVVQRLLAQQCEVCGATDNIEVHHIRKLADLKAYGNHDKPQWVKIMAIRRRKTLVVCQKCHQSIHSGNYIGPRLSK